MTNNNNEDLDSFIYDLHSDSPLPDNTQEMIEDVATYLMDKISEIDTPDYQEIPEEIAVTMLVSIMEDSLRYAVEKGYDEALAVQVVRQTGFQLAVKAKAAFVEDNGHGN